ncbi:MAG: class I SAM-dependent methyltransferase [Sphingopyxis sp.]|nr:class I SAM-dependent methyltransferase [Sphingopyxis sp.]
MIETPSPDKAFYDAEAIGVGENHAIFVREISGYFASYAQQLNDDLRGTTGVIVELGAGSCTLSCNASQLENVTRVIAADISSKRMEKSIVNTAALLDADIQKITTVECDFNDRLPFDDQSVDAIMFDAALHHARNIWNLISECQRVLTPSGKLIAQRESYLNALRADRQMAYLLKTPEVSAQVSENMYLKSQYEYYLKVNGFSVEFIPYTRSRLKRILGFANGWLFVDGSLYYSKV